MIARALRPGAARVVATIAALLASIADGGEAMQPWFHIPFYADAAVFERVRARHRTLLQERTVKPPGEFRILLGGRLVRYGTDEPAVPASGVLAVAWSEIDGRLYGITQHAAYALGGGGRQAAEIRPRAGYPPMSWLRSITYDATMRRLVMTASNQVYTYDPVASEWRIFHANDREWKVGLIAYHPGTRRLYGVEGGDLVVLDGLMRPQGRIAFDHPFRLVDGLGPGAGVQLVAAGDGLLICGTSGDASVARFMHGRVTTRCYWIELPSGRVSIADMAHARRGEP